MAEYYPDLIHHTDVINAPPFFAVCWAAAPDTKVSKRSAKVNRTL